MSSPSVYGFESTDPQGILADRSQLSKTDLGEIEQIMSSMGRLRAVERKAAEASQRYMRLNETDMRALHYLIVAENRGEVVTPSILARHLGITSASITKMLDRLEVAGHIFREEHPSDRRAFTIHIVAETRAAALATVGRYQASRLSAAAKLSSAERLVVSNFLSQTAEDLEKALHFVDSTGDEHLRIAH
ncbi:MAG: MarR family transcriptional regulator [Microbacteriaceae bacterium]